GGARRAGGVRRRHLWPDGPVHVAAGGLPARRRRRPASTSLRYGSSAEASLRRDTRGACASAWAGTGVGTAPGGIACGRPVALWAAGFSAITRNLFSSIACPVGRMIAFLPA